MCYRFIDRPFLCRFLLELRFCIVSFVLVNEDQRSRRGRDVWMGWSVLLSVDCVGVEIDIDSVGDAISVVVGLVVDVVVIVLDYVLFRIGIAFVPVLGNFYLVVLRELVSLAGIEFLLLVVSFLLKHVCNWMLGFESLILNFPCRVSILL